jgi:hypothetical protein
MQPSGSSAAKACSSLTPSGKRRRIFTAASPDDTEVRGVTADDNVVDGVIVAMLGLPLLMLFFVQKGIAGEAEPEDDVSTTSQKGPQILLWPSSVLASSPPKNDSVRVISSKSSKRTSGPSAGDIFGECCGLSGGLKPSKV